MVTMGVESHVTHQGLPFRERGLKALASGRPGLSLALRQAYADLMSHFADDSSLEATRTQASGQPGLSRGRWLSGTWARLTRKS